jgi:hypothetical protein
MARIRTWLVRITPLLLALAAAKPPRLDTFGWW